MNGLENLSQGLSLNQLTECEAEEETIFKSQEEPFSSKDNISEVNLPFSNSDEAKINLFNDNGNENIGTELNNLNKSNLLDDEFRVFPQSCEDLHFDSKLEKKRNAQDRRQCIIKSDFQNVGEFDFGVYDFNCSSDEGKTDERKLKMKKSKTIPKKVVRKSAKAAIETINAIKSETQRLHRENQVTIPYHQPKRCTLKEFMSRKTALKPNVKANDCQRFCLKMNKKQLKKYDNFLKKREEEAEKLFVNDDFEKSVVQNCDDIISKTGHESHYSNSNNSITSKINYLLNTSTGECETEDRDCFENNNSFVNDDIKSYSEPVKYCPSNIEKQYDQKALTKEEEIKKPKIQIISNIQISAPIIRPSKEIVLQLKQLITEEAINSNIQPKLNGNSASLIDLESGDILPLHQKKICGADKLLQKYVNANSKKLVLQTGDKQDELKVSNELKSDIRPGASYVKLKNNLMRQIKEQRKLEIKKKIKHHKEEEEIAFKIFEEENCEDESNNLVNDNVEEVEEYESDIENIISYHETNKEVQEQCENDSDFDDISDDGEADDESCKSGDFEIRKKRNGHKRTVLGKNSSENEEISENMDFSLKYPLEETEVENPGLVKTEIPSKIDIVKQLCNVENNVNNDEELFELCSGTFGKTQNTIQDENFINFSYVSDISHTKSFQSSILNNDDKVSCSSEEEIICGKSQSWKKINTIEYSDEEYSDKDINNSINKESVEDVELKNDQKTFLDYGSDENEIQKEAVKKQINKEIDEFFEKEAELSESDWGSADEDEKNLDKYDIELGDEDEFDQEKLKDELGRIHMRKMLDEDARQVKKMQELFFEDEEKDGIGRQRQFRWKKAETTFNLDSNVTFTEPDTVESDEDNEEFWRKMKYEREMFLKDKLESNSFLPLKNETENNIQNSMEKKLVTKRFVSMSRPKFNEIDVITDSSFLIYKSSIKSIRSSFLKRGGDVLTKVASITSHVSEFDGISTAQSHTGKKKNFIFSILRDKPESIKRKTCTSNINFSEIKKVKLDHKND